MELDRIEFRRQHAQHVLDSGGAMLQLCDHCRQLVHGDLPALLCGMAQLLDEDVLAGALTRAQYFDNAIGAEERNAVAELAHELAAQLRELLLLARPLPARST